MNGQHSWARRVAILSLLVFVAIVVFEHATVSELSPLSHQVSEYANAGDGWLMTVGFLAWALSFAATAMTGPPGTIGTLVRVLLGVCVAGAVLLALFRTQTVAGVLPAGEQRTLAGRLHDLGGAVVTFGLFGAATVSALQAGPGRYRRLTIALLATAIATSVSLLLVGAEVGGLRQRVTLGIACLWQLAFCSRDRLGAREGRFML